MPLLGSSPKDPRAEAERLFATAAQAAAPQLGPLTIANGRRYVTERSELQPTFKAEVERAAAAACPRPAVSPSLKENLTRWYTTIGPFDISLDWSGKAVAYGELKSGPDTNSSANCVWDAAKLALVVRTGVAACGHLIASAPATLWQPRIDGIELFFDGEWDMLDLRERYASWWRKWEKEGYMPLRIPDRLRTYEVETVDFDCAGTSWRVGVACVEPARDGWVDWTPFFPERWQRT